MSGKLHYLWRVVDQDGIELAMMVDAGMSAADTIICATSNAAELIGINDKVGEYLGVHPKIGNCSDMGGAAFEFFVHHALLAISQGRCECAL